MESTTTDEALDIIHRLRSRWQARPELDSETKWMDIMKVVGDLQGSKDLSDQVLAVSDTDSVQRTEG